MIPFFIEFSSCFLGYWLAPLFVREPPDGCQRDQAVIKHRSFVPELHSDLSLCTGFGWLFELT
jgi:hypothetical protein